MVKQATKNKTEPKGKRRTAKATKAAGQAQVVKKMLHQLEEKMDKDQMKATMGDYIRLVQLHKELDDESPKEIKVTYADFTLSGTVAAGQMRAAYSSWIPLRAASLSMR